MTFALFSRSLRLQAFLCLKMFKTKKPEAAKLKRILDEHSKTASSSTTTSSAKQAPSPYQPAAPSGGWPRSTGTPSPMSPQPSPAGSIASVGSVVSPPPCYVSPTPFLISSRLLWRLIQMMGGLSRVLSMPSTLAHSSRTRPLQPP